MKIMHGDHSQSHQERRLPMECMSLAIQQVLGQQAHKSHTPLALVLGYIVPSPQACQHHQVCSALLAPLQKPGVVLLHLYGMQACDSMLLTMELVPSHGTVGMGL